MLEGCAGACGTGDQELERFQRLLQFKLSVRILMRREQASPTDNWLHVLERGKTILRKILTQIVKDFALQVL